MSSLFFMRFISGFMPGSDAIKRFMLFGLGMSSAILLTNAFMPKVRDASDLETIVGYFDSSYSHASPSHSGYIIKTNNQSCRFSISGEAGSYFQRDRFEAEVKRGDFIQIQVPTWFHNNLNSNQNVETLGVVSNNKIYLDPGQAVEAFNSFFPTIPTLIFVLSSIAYISRCFYTIFSKPINPSAA